MDKPRSLTPPPLPPKPITLMGGLGKNINFSKIIYKIN
jgi:hypothetical protein